MLVNIKNTQNTGSISVLQYKDTQITPPSDTCRVRLQGTRGPRQGVCTTGQLRLTALPQPRARGQLSVFCLRTVICLAMALASLKSAASEMRCRWWVKCDLALMRSCPYLVRSTAFFPLARRERRRRQGRERVATPSSDSTIIGTTIRRLERPSV